MELLFYTSRTAAALLECHYKTVERLCRSGDIRAVKRLRKWYIMPNALAEYIKTAALTVHG